MPPEKKLELPEEEEFEAELAPEGEVPVEEVAPETELVEEMPEGMSHTVDEIPELAGKEIGDTITLRIDSISDDGNTYELSPVAEGEEFIEEEEMIAPGAGATEEIEAAFLG